MERGLVIHYRFLYYRYDGFNRLITARCQPGDRHVLIVIVPANDQSSDKHQ